MGGSARKGSIHIEASLNSAKVVTGAQAARAEVRAMAKQMRTDVQTAKQEVRLLGEELGLHLPRSLQTFVAKLPGVANLMASAFAATAVLSLGKIAFDVGEKMYEAGQKAKKATQELHDSFAAIFEQQNKTSISLDITNDKLEQEIAKLEHKPSDGLKLGLDQAREAAHNLGMEMESAAKAKEALLKENHVGLWEQIKKDVNPFDTGLPKAYTEHAETLISDHDKARNGKQKDAEDSLDGADPKDKASKSLRNYVDMQILLTTQIRETTAALNEENKAAAKDKGWIDHSGNIEMLSNQLRDEKKYRADAQKADQNVDLEAKKSSLEAAKEASEEAKQAAEKAFHAQMEGFEQRLAALKQGGAEQIGQEHDFWEAMLGETKRGSLAYLEINKKLGPLFQEEMKALSEAQKTWLEAQKKFAEEEAKADERLLEVKRELDAADAARADNINQLHAVQTKNIDDLEELALKHREATGEISAYSAAQGIAALRTKTQTEELARLQAKLDEMGSGSPMDDKEQVKQRGDLEQKIASLQGAMASANEVDQWELAQKTAFGGLRSAMDELVVKARDISGQIRDEFKEALNGVNEELEKAMQGKKTDWGKMGSNLFGSVSKNLLQAGEGKLMGMLPGAKRDGSTAANALYVLMAQQEAKKSAVDGSMDMISQLAARQNSTSFGAGFMSMMANVLIPHAAGGPISAGMAYMVGEHGPEPFFPGVSGSMATNEAMRSAMGNGHGTQLHVHIDASHSSDPAHMEFVARRAVMDAAPHIIAAANSSAQERSKNRPLSAR